MTNEKSSMKLNCESYQRKKWQTIEKELTHKNVGQAKRCDEVFYLHCARVDED
jgi:hypothetical protein